MGFDTPRECNIDLYVHPFEVEKEYSNIDVHYTTELSISKKI